MILYIDESNIENLQNSVIHIDPILFNRLDLNVAVNDIVIINKSFATSVISVSQTSVLVKRINLDVQHGIQPVDIHQKSFLHFLFNPDVPLVTCLAPAGCGKTYLSLYAIIELLQRKQYDRAIIIKPLVSVTDSKFLGTLPGDLDEKIAPFLSSFYDVAYSLNSVRTLETLIDRDKIAFEPIDFIRGRTFERTLILCDEIQNLTDHQLLTLGTRIGVDSKLVLIGDPKQVDNRHTVDLLSFVENYHYENSPHSTTVKLFKRMRSPITEIFENIFE